MPGKSHTIDEEDVGADVDEPPDRPLLFSKMSNTGARVSGSESGDHASTHYRKSSLLTQALTSPELMPMSDAEAPVLTSDGGMTSPARTSTPSPPLPALAHAPLAPLELKDVLGSTQEQDTAKPSQDPGIGRTQEGKVEEGLGRRRCISFACSLVKPSQDTKDKSAKEVVSPENPVAAAAPPKRPCMLRFACPMKPSRSEQHDNPKLQQAQKPPQSTTSPQIEMPQQLNKVHPDAENSRASMDSQSAMFPQKALLVTVPTDKQETQIVSDSAVTSASSVPSTALSPSIVTQDRRIPFNRVDFQKSEATRFHEFAGSFTEEGEWANEQTAFRQKITINDTLRKENAIRKLAEEAEEEAREEDEEAYENANQELDDASDDGNETDDEEGFADSDDESDGGSSYQFWTPGDNNTAATSTDHIEPIRSTSQRVASESSVESVVKETFEGDNSSKMDSRQVPKRARLRSGARPGATNFRDSSEFVVGTIDEDQPLEDAYLSRLKQKERSRQKLIPQDIDPSFPTSDPEAENEEDEEPEDDDMDEDNEVAKLQDTMTRATNGTKSREDTGTRRSIRSPSPRRFHSPPPPARRLFGQAVHRLHSPPPAHRKLLSPPSSRRPSLSGSPTRTQGIDITRLAQRPNLTHTTSLPRTPNPFWGHHRRSHFHGPDTPSPGTSPKSFAPISQDAHHRGPIDIVQGLENKRQRRKEKFWRHQCSKAHAGKEKERRCQPGKGAQRMREVGLVMADRFKGYKQGGKLVLSV